MTAPRASRAPATGAAANDDRTVVPPRDLADCIELLALAERDAQARAEEASGLRGRADERDRLAAALSAAEAERDALLTSTSWRLTAPLRALVQGLSRTRQRTRDASPPRYAGSASSVAPPRLGGARDLDPASHPTTFPEPAATAAPRVSLLVDHLGSGDDAACAPILLALALAIAQQPTAPLRILTRRAPADPAALDDLLSSYGLTCPGNPSFDWLAPAGHGPGLGICEGERAVVGQRVGAWLASGMFGPRRLIYVIDDAEVAHLTATAGDRRTRALFAASRPTLVFASAAVAAALHRSGLLAQADAEGTARTLTLPDQPWTPDWHRAIQRFVDDWVQA